MLATVTAFATSAFGAIGWDPEIRNYLSVLVGVARGLIGVGNQAG